MSAGMCIPKGAAKGVQTLYGLASLPHVLPRLTPTPLAIHVGMSLPVSTPCFVGGGAESLRDIQEGVATIQDPCHLSLCLSQTCHPPAQTVISSAHLHHVVKVLGLSTTSTEASSPCQHALFPPNASSGSQLEVRNRDKGVSIPTRSRPLTWVSNSDLCPLKFYFWPPKLQSSPLITKLETLPPSDLSPGLPSPLWKPSPREK